jgi:hypothetical protein
MRDSPAKCCERGSVLVSTQPCPATGLLHSGNPETRRKIDVGRGWVAQLAEQWTENPRVGGSIPPPAIPAK